MILWFFCRSQGHSMISKTDRSEYSNCILGVSLTWKEKIDTSKKCQFHRSLLRQSLNYQVVFCTLEAFVKWLVSNSNHLFWMIPVMHILAYLLLKSHWNELHSLSYNKCQKKLDPLNCIASFLGTCFYLTSCTNMLGFFNLDALLWSSSTRDQKEH